MSFLAPSGSVSAELLRRRAAEPLRPSVAQEVPGGLFGDLLGQRELLPRRAEEFPALFTAREKTPALFAVVEHGPGPTAERYAAEHKRFLEQHNPAVLHQQSDPASYLSSVGQQAAEMYRHLMYQHDRRRLSDTVAASREALRPVRSLVVRSEPVLE